MQEIWVMDKTSGKLQVEQNQWSVKKKKYSWSAETRRVVD